MPNLQTQLILSHQLLPQNGDSASYKTKVTTDQTMILQHLSCVILWDLTVLPKVCFALNISKFACPKNKVS